MRKSKLLLVATMCCTMLLFAGCSKKTTDYSKYVELGEYKGIEVTVDSTEVTDDEVDTRIESILESDAQDVDVTDRAVQTDDIVNIDYVGKIDGKEFEGGSAKDYNLTIGSGTFIDDFEDQLVGAKIGDVVEVNATFPDEYESNEELAGKEAVFTVTINSIKETVVPKLTDDWVKEYTEEKYKTVDEYKESVKADLKTEKEEAAQINKTADVLTKIVENSKITGYPEDEVETYVKDMKSQYEYFASMYGLEFDDFITSWFGKSVDEFEKEINTLAKETIARQMVCKLIAQAEGMTVSEEEYQAGLEKYAVEYTTSSTTYTPESFEKAFGKDVVTENILLEKVLEFITENAVEV